MTEPQIEVLRRVRSHIAEWQESIELLESREVRLYSGREDLSDAHIAMLKSLIERQQAFVDEYDPEGLTAPA